MLNDIWRLRGESSVIMTASVADDEQSAFMSLKTLPVTHPPSTSNENACREMSSGMNRNERAGDESGGLLAGFRRLDNLPLSRVLQSVSAGLVIWLKHARSV